MSTPAPTPEAAPPEPPGQETAAALFERFGPNYRWFAAATAIVGAFAMILSSTIVNVAVPDIMGSFGIDQDTAQWMATAFLAAMTASQLLNAWVVKALGQRHAYTLVLLVFVVGTFFCAGAPTIEVLVFGRVLQGLAAGIVQPLSMVTLFQLFPPERRGLAMGLYGMGVTLAPGVGPTVGGMVIDASSWHSVFLLPLPFCIAGLLAGPIFMPNDRTRGGLPPFDWTGLGLLSLSLVLLLQGAANGRRDGWSSDLIVLTFVGGITAGVLFVVLQLRSKAPLLDISLFKNRQFASALAVAFVFGAGNFGSSYISPVFVQTVQGFTPTRAGLALLPAGMFLVIALPLTGRIADKVPDYLMTMAGLCLFSLGTGLLVSSDVNTDFWTFSLCNAVGRFGLAFILPSLSAAALRALPADQLNRGSGNINFIRQLGGAVGTNLIVVWLEHRTQLHAAQLTATQTPDNSTTVLLIDKVSSTVARAGLPDPHHAYAYDYLGRVIHAQAQVFGFQDAFLALSVIFLAALVPAYVLSRTSRPKAATATRKEPRGWVRSTASR